MISLASQNSIIFPKTFPNPNPNFLGVAATAKVLNSGN
ncbi:hypothetical protein M6B38_417285 [Iris pallida]|uniref:Uncharacterized protein n=1 Tax=Iris pallida TaxID=29817 RepID=A0AAX6FI94_IRIPA|nr:hypothetical protein M6B38_417285 [Iris pallida]